MTLFIYVVSHFLYMVSHYLVRHGFFIRFFYFFQKKCEKIAEFGFFADQSFTIHLIIFLLFTYFS